MKETVTYTSSNCIGCIAYDEKKRICYRTKDTKITKNLNIKWDNFVPDKCPLRGEDKVLSTINERLKGLRDFAESKHCNGLVYDRNWGEVYSLEWLKLALGYVKFEDAVQVTLPPKSHSNQIPHKVINGNVVLEEKTESLMNGDRIVAVNYDKWEGEFYLTNTKNNPITTEMVDKEAVFLAYTRWYSDKAYDKLKEINFNF